MAPFLLTLHAGLCIALVGAAIPVAAQTAPSASGMKCAVHEIAMPKETRTGRALPPVVQVVCGNSAIQLGPAEQYSSSYNASMGGTVVVRLNGGHHSVELVTLTPTGLLHVDNVSRELAKGLGLYTEADLRDVDIDVSRFATDGRVSVLNTSETRAADEALQPSDLGTADRVTQTKDSGSARSSTTLDLLPYARRVKMQGVTEPSDGA